VSGFLLDTHVWWWYLTGSDRLPGGLRRAIDASPAECWLSPISVWELGMLVRRGRVRIPSTYAEWLGEALRLFPVREAPLTTKVALDSLVVALPHHDPADRFLAATCIVHGLILLTVDRRLTGARGVPTRSR
jgi:PIN domain nuclease of toxin-antitoxin system